MRTIGVLILTLIIHSNLIAQIDETTSLINKGFDFIVQAKYPEAIDYLDRALARDSTSSLAYHNRGYAKFELSDFEGALQDFISASFYESNNPAYYFLAGNSLSSMNRYKEAIHYYDIALKIAEEGHEYYFARATANIKLGKYQSALSDLNQTILLYPDQAGAWHNRGFVKYNLKDIRGACKDWQKALSMGFKGSDYYVKNYCP